MGERIRLDNLALYAKNEDGAYTKVGDIQSASMSIDHFGDVAKIECETYFDLLNTYAATNRNMRKIDRVIFNAPATIVLWGDGSKTVVKCGPDECYDPEKGLAMAISKRFLGDKGNYYEEFKKWLPEKDPVADFINKVRFFSKWAKDHIPGFGRR